MKGDATNEAIPHFWKQTQASFKNCKKFFRSLIAGKSCGWTLSVDFHKYVLITVQINMQRAGFSCSGDD